MLAALWQQLFPVHSPPAWQGTLHCGKGAGVGSTGFGVGAGAGGGVGGGGGGVGGAVGGGVGGAGVGASLEQARAPVLHTQSPL